MKHSHEKLKKRWLKGAKIQVLTPSTSEWKDVYDPLWIADQKYRLKPEPKKDADETKPFDN